jgi:hypothetical protein
MSGFLRVSAHWNFLACEIIFIQRSICEITREASFRAVPRTSQARQYQFPLACPHLFFIYFQAMPSKNHASRKQAIIDTDTSKTHANPKTENPARLAPVSTTLPNPAF